MVLSVPAEEASFYEYEFPSSRTLITLGWRETTPRLRQSSNEAAATPGSHILSLSKSLAQPTERQLVL
jgi:hypothetical protein